MKKSLFIIIIMVTALSLTGCSNIKEYVGEKMLQKSGVYEDSGYQEYEKYSDEGLVDSNGNCVETVPETEEEHAQIHVTFAENNNLDVQYYSDSDQRIAIDKDNCYVNPGDAIYAAVKVDDAVFSSMYSFSEFRIYEYDVDNKRTQSTELVMGEKDGKYILNIPESFTGTDVSVEPIGTYQMRTIALRDYYTDDNGHENDLPGTWIVNDKEYTSDTAEISPVSSYIISYEYDSNEYFYVSSSPECYYSNNTDGQVIFNQREADDDTEDYSVELHKYMSVQLISDKKRTVSVNDGDAQDIQASGELVIDHLKYGDTVTIKTDTEWGNLESNRELILTNQEAIKDSEYKYKYTLTVPEKGGEFTFDPSAYTYEHGQITFKCFGSAVTTPQILSKGRKIYYEEASADNGWWLAGNASEHCITVKDAAETQAELKAIHFTQMVNVTVNLPQPEEGGAVIYKLDNNKISGTSVSTYSGVKISMQFDPWEGWISSVTGEVTYEVGEEPEQTVNVDGKGIDSLFNEDEEHMPELYVKLEPSVGESMSFTIQASQYEMKATSYDGAWQITDIFNGKRDLISNQETIVSGDKIGTADPINITMNGKAVQYGTAVRMIITMTDSDNNKTSETRYIDDLSKEIDPIYIYKSGTNATSTTWYKSIDITIGVVDIETFTSAKPSDHSTISVKNQSTNKKLSSGDLLETSTKVVVTIIPDSGYYVSGSKVTNDVYSETMNFSDYQKNIDSIISNHNIDKYNLIMLDSSDAYAAYTYKLDGSVVSGTVYVKEGQNLELTYEITGGQHELTEGYGGIPLVGWFSSNTKATKSITITADMDGTTITKSDFGFETK